MRLPLAALACMLVLAGCAAPPQNPLLPGVKTFSFPGPIPELNNLGRRIGSVQGIVLTLEPRTTPTNEHQTLVTLNYNYDNSAPGDTINGEQRLYIDGLDASGAVIKPAMFTELLPRYNCWRRDRSQTDNYVSFDDYLAVTAIAARIDKIEGQIQNPC